MRIVVIVGITDTGSGILNKKLWEYLEEVFHVEFPGAEIVVERQWFLPWEFEKIRKFADGIVAKHDTGEDLILMGHSMGGVIACSIAGRFEKSRIRMVSTIFSPHLFLWKWFSQKIGSNLDGFGDIPVVTFQAKYDTLVWWGSRYPTSISHTVLDCDHHFLWLHFTKKPLAYIAREMRRLL